MSSGDGDAQHFGKLGLREVGRAGTTALELADPAGEGACVGVAGVIGETAAAAVGVQQKPGACGGIGERVDGTEARGGGIGGDDCAPDGVLLGGTEQQFVRVTFEQEAMPEAS